MYFYDLKMRKKVWNGTKLRKYCSETKFRYLFCSGEWLRTEFRKFFVSRNRGIPTKQWFIPSCFVFNEIIFLIEIGNPIPEHLMPKSGPWSETDFQRNALHSAMMLKLMSKGTEVQYTEDIIQTFTSSFIKIMIYPLITFANVPQEASTAMKIKRQSMY